ncbi:MAG: 3'-5' exonuclease [Trizodia sp. TS-e1964]|nr:MAG: 3'-5' exonuclease [Trizodia sp. TS-e1964]
MSETEAHELSSNWKRLQATLQVSSHSNTPKSSPLPTRHRLNRKNKPLIRPRKRTPPHSTITPSPPPPKVEAGSNPDAPLHTSTIGKYISIDCEMVGVGPPPSEASALARVSIVNYHGAQIYDTYVRPLERVTDWRTPISGVAPRHMAQAPPFAEVQAEVAALLAGRILIGHALRNDLQALLLEHPARDTRDTARHKPFRVLAGGRSPALKKLASELLGVEIQGGMHSSVEDARTAMLLYRRDKDAFEAEHARRFLLRPSATPKDPGAEKASAGKELKKKKKKKKGRKR